MTWTTFHHRGEVLRAVTEAADARRDGVLPDGRDRRPRDLRRRAHPARRPPAALAHPPVGAPRAALLDRPADLEQAVVRAWHATADELPGTRLVLDHYRAEPLDDAMAAAIATSVAKERILLAANAGRAGARTEDTVAAGRDLEQRARDSYRAPASPARAEPALLDRIRAHVA